VSFLLFFAGAYLALCLLLFFAQRSLVYLPPRPTATVEVERLEVAGAALAIAVRPLAVSGALVYFGGNAEDVGRSLPELATVAPDRALYLPFYRGYGESTGAPSEAALLADALAVFDRVRGEHSDVAVVGRSIGSAVALSLGSLRPVSRLVLVTPFDSLAATARRHFPIVPTGWILRDRFEAWRWAEKVEAPTLVLVAERDEIVSRQQSERLFAAFRPGVATLRVVSDADHNSIALTAEVADFLRAGGR
jgi:uncharacterized protein